MEENKFYNEEQERQLMERINEIKNQTAKENKTEEIEEKEQLDTNTGIENVVVYQNNAKKTMKGKKGIAIALASIVLIGGIIFGTSKNSSSKQPTEPVEMVTYIDENGEEQQIEKYIYMTFEPYEFHGIIEIEIAENEYSKYDEDFLYGSVFEELQKQHFDDGYDENDPLDILAWCSTDQLTSDFFDKEDNVTSFFEIEGANDIFELIDGKIRPKNGKFTYYVSNVITIEVKCTFDEKTLTYIPDRNIKNAKIIDDVDKLLKKASTIN